MLMLVQIARVRRAAHTRTTISCLSRIRSLAGALVGLTEQLDSTNPAFTPEQRRLMGTLQQCGQNLDVSLGMPCP